MKRSFYTLEKKSSREYSVKCESNARRERGWRTLSRQVAMNQQALQAFASVDRHVSAPLDMDLKVSGCQPRLPVVEDMK